MRTMDMDQSLTSSSNDRTGQHTNGLEHLQRADLLQNEKGK